MSALKLHDAGYRYLAGPTIGPLSLAVQPGERVLLSGASGCGKSTLLRLAAGLLGRHGAGQVLGRVRVAGQDPALLSPAARARQLGFVSQEPADQLLSGRVDDEITFSLGGQAPDPGRVSHWLAQVGLDVAHDRDPRTLSGGQQQRLVVAATLAAGAPLLLLDEPLAQLDPQGAHALLRVLSALAAQGTAVLLVEHRLEATLPWADRLVVLSDDGPITRSPSQIDAAFLQAHGLELPGQLRLEAQGVCSDQQLIRCVQRALPDPGPPQGPVLLEQQVEVVRGGRSLLQRQTFRVHAGERVAILGANGAGKSSLLGALDGLLVPQDPDLSLFSATVAEELSHGPREHRRPLQIVDRVAQPLGLAELLGRPPQALSRGQRLRVAVGAALCCRPSVLLLDEPTAGQDHQAVRRMLSALHQLLGQRALVFATHDVGLALRWASRLLVLDQGRVVAEGAPGRVLATLELPAIRLPPVAARCRALGLPCRDAIQLVGGR